MDLTFRVVSVENLRDQRKSEKKSRFHSRNVPNGNSCSISSKPFLIRVSAFRDPFFGKCNWLQQMVNAILEGKLPVLTFAYHNLPKPWTNRFAHEIALVLTTAPPMFHKGGCEWPSVIRLSSVKWPRSPRSFSALADPGGFLLCLTFSKFSYILTYQFCEFRCSKKKKLKKKIAVSVFRFAVSWFSIYCLWKTQVDQLNID